MFEILSVSLFLSFALASPDTAVRPGTYSAPAEAESTTSFELKANGEATVSPLIEEDIEDGKFGKLYPTKTIPGTWKSVPGGIELSYGKVTDQFVLEAQCRQWPKYYCLRYKKTLKGQKTELQNTDKPFINWDWVYSGPKVVHKLSKKCVDECTKMKNNGELKEGMSIQTCGETICEDAAD